MGTDPAFSALLEMLNRPRRRALNRILAGRARHGDYVRLYLTDPFPQNIVPRPPLTDPPQWLLPPPPPEEPDEEPERGSMWQ